MGCLRVGVGRGIIISCGRGGEGLWLAKWIRN